MTLQQFKSHTDRDILRLFNRKFEEIEVPFYEFVRLVEIHPKIKYIFMEKTTFVNNFDRLTIACSALEQGIIGNLWGADVVILPNLSLLARFTGENGSIAFIQEDLPEKYNPIILPPCSLKYLEI